jgi:Ca2+ transporting ATPase
MAAIAVSMILHMLILYVHPLAIMFSVTPLTFSEWKAVFWLSFPVILVDELLKFFSRRVKGNPFTTLFIVVFPTVVALVLVPAKNLRCCC